jgi:hypothetical protein
MGSVVAKTRGNKDGHSGESRNPEILRHHTKTLDHGVRRGDDFHQGLLGGLNHGKYTGKRLEKASFIKG